MIYKRSYPIIILILFISCLNEDNKDLNSNDIEINSNGNFQNNILDIITLPELITLDETNKKVFKYITNGYNYNQTYYLSTNKYDGELYILNNKGDLINTIKDKGDSPIQYRELTSFSIDKKNQELYIHDFQKQRFLIYDLKGDFLRVQPIAYNFLWFCLSEEYIYLFTAKHENYINEISFNYDLLVLDRDFNIIDKYLPFDASKFSEFRLHKNNPFYYSNNNELYFNDVFSDTIYGLNNGKLYTAYPFKYINQTVSSDFRNKPHLEIINEITKNKDLYLDLDMMANLYAINDHFLISQFTHNANPHYAFKSLKTNNSINYTLPSMYKNDVDYHHLLKPIFIEEDYFVCMVYPYVLEFLKEEYLKKHKQESSFTKKIDFILENNIKDGNQVIIKYKIKNN